MTEISWIHITGQDVTVSIDIESREFNGRWYTDVRAWNVVNGVQVPGVAAPAAGFAPAPAPGFAPQQPVAQPVQSAPAAAPTTADDLP